ncbi:TPA: molybdenum transporter [Candidatus Bipolaricaulota bacterium]|nr:molybdenum transporter [Candidatus Bipolaricaulota bacterium]
MRPMKRVVVLVIGLWSLLALGQVAWGGEELVISTTTSVYDTGLLDRLNAAFGERFGVMVKVIAVGTGAALRLAREGNVDLVLVHARAAEDEFLRGGWGINRRDVMYNDFVLVGPPDDPAGVGGLKSVAEAFRRIAESRARFLSRGDDSGTHKRELSLWEVAGVTPDAPWYMESGKGQGDNLVQASLMGAYTLTDRGTFISLQERLELLVLVEGPLNGGDPLLMNPYGVIAVNPAVYPNRNYIMAMAYIGFLTSPEGQHIIEEFRVNGERLFVPMALSREPRFEQYVPQDWRR